MFCGRDVTMHGNILQVCWLFPPFFIIRFSLIILLSLQVFGEVPVSCCLLFLLLLFVLVLFFSLTLTLISDLTFVFIGSFNLVQL